MLKTVDALYAQKAYKEALDYLAKNKSSLPKGLWHYNMGTLFAKLEDWPMARYHLAMADVQGFSAQELSLNQRLVEKKLSIDKWEKPLTFRDYLVRGASVGSEGIFTLIGLVILIIGIVQLKNRSQRKRSLVVLSLSLLLFGLSFWIKSWDWSIVLKPQDIQEGPSAIFNSKDEIPQGVKILTRREGEWVQIIFPERFEGWIRDAELKELK